MEQDSDGDGMDDSAAEFTYNADGKLASYALIQAPTVS